MNSQKWRHAAAGSSSGAASQWRNFWADLEPFGLKHESAELADKPWYRLLTRYHWFVLLVASLGWMFDCLDQQLFILARLPRHEGTVGRLGARFE